MPLGSHSGNPRSYFLRKREQLELLAQLAVVAALGFLQLFEVLGQLLGLGKRDAVNARELLVFLVAAPVGAGHVEQLHGLNGSRIGQVRAAAEVDEVALLVERDGAVFEALQQVQLVGVGLFGEVSHGFGFGHGAPLELAFLAGQLQHLLLDFREVFARNRAAFAQVDVVVKAVFDGRADAQLHAGVQRFEGFGQHVGRGVPEGHLTVVVVPGQDGYVGILFNGAVQVAHFAVYAHAYGVAGQAFADSGGDIVARRAIYKLAHRAVGEGDIQHKKGLMAIQTAVKPQVKANE